MSKIESKKQVRRPLGGGRKRPKVKQMQAVTIQARPMARTLWSSGSDSAHHPRRLGVQILARSIASRNVGGGFGPGISEIKVMGCTAKEHAASLASSKLHRIVFKHVAEPMVMVGRSPRFALGLKVTSRHSVATNDSVGCCPGRSS